MSPVIPDSGGFVVISQVRPHKDEGKGPEEGSSHNAPASLPKPVFTFYKGEPEVLGTTQIFTGILLLSIGILTIIMDTYSMAFSIIAIIGVPVWSGILFIISGSLSVAASVKPTVGKIKASLGMHIVNSIASTIGIIIAAIELSLMPSPYTYYHRGIYCAHYKGDLQCLGDFKPMDVSYGVTAFILMLFLLMFCISISTSVFACRTVCRSAFEEMNVVIYQTTSLMVSDATRDVPPDPSAALTS